MNITKKSSRVLTQNKFAKKTFLIFFLVFLAVPRVIFCQTENINYVDGFDFPVGKPEGNGYYNAQGIGIWNQKFRGFHLGEDWNKNCGGDCDLGDPVYSIADGKVVFKSFEKTWGNIVIIRHTFNDGTQVDSMYAHLKDVQIGLKDNVFRGFQIGTIGKGDGGVFAAHLHFEIRDNLSIGKGVGYGSQNHPGYLNPTEFIKAHRPIKPPILSQEYVRNEGIKLSWNKAEIETDKIEIYRSTEQNGTKEQSKRTLLATINKVDETSFLDKNGQFGVPYFYSLGLFAKNGMFVQSNEVSTIRPQEIIKIEATSAQQSEPVIANGKVFWTDYYADAKNKYFVHYYDLETKEKGEFLITDTKAGKAEEVDAGGGFAIFQAKVYGEGSNIYAINLENGSNIVVNSELSKKQDQVAPSISEKGISVWADMRNGKDYDIFLRDLNFGDESLFVGGIGNQRNPEISGNFAVWIDSRVGNRHDLYIKNIWGGEEIKLDENVNLAEPDIWQNYVVWPKDRQIKIYDIEKKTTTILNGATTYFHVARVDDGKIAHLESGKNLVYIFDLKTQKHKIIETGDLIPKSAYAVGNVVAFSAKAPAEINDDIYITWY